MKSVRLTSKVFCALLLALTARAGDLFLSPIPALFVAADSTIASVLSAHESVAVSNRGRRRSSDQLRSINSSVKDQGGISRAAVGTIISAAVVADLVLHHVHADRVLCVFNRANQPAEREFVVGPELTDGSYCDELTSAATSVENGRMTVTVAPRSAALSHGL